MYKAILFAPDGEFVTDYPGHTKEEVREWLANLGSRWLFYPIAAIVVDHPYTTDRHRIVDATEPFDHFLGGSVGYASRWLKRHPDLVEAILNA